MSASEFYIPQCERADSLGGHACLRSINMIRMGTEEEREVALLMAAEDGGTVCVTGASGFIPSWLVKRLLERGYHVRAVVRDPHNPAKVNHLKDLPDAATKLSIYKGDLLDEGTYDAAIDGCTGVFHSASPMNFFTAKDPENEIIKPAVDGMLNVLRSCVKAKTVKRVVYTASISAILMGKNPPTVEYDESCWTDVDLCRNTKFPGWSYYVAKTVAERTAWDFAKEHGIDLVTVLPPYVFGPFLASFRPSTIELAIALHVRKKHAYPMLMRSRAVHVDDVCSAHIYLFEHPEAEGRYICSSHNFNIVQLAKSLAKKYPEYNIPTQFEGVDESATVVPCSSKKLLDLGFKFEYDPEKYDVGDVFADAIECCKAKGLLPPPA